MNSHNPTRLPRRQAYKRGCNNQNAGSVQVLTNPASRPRPPREISLTPAWTLNANDTH